MTYALPAPRRLRTTGPVWVVLRLHRVALWTWTAVVVASVLVLLWLYGPGADAALRHLAACTAPGCEPDGGAWGRYKDLYELTAAPIAAAPYAATILMGGICVGRELERGTAQLMWAQALSPARWLATTLAVPAAWFTAGMVPLVALHHLVWSSGPLPRRDLPWHDPDLFATTGTLPLTRVLLGLALGALAGVLYRRAATGGLAGIAVLLVTGVLGMRYRASLWPTATDTGLEALRPPSDAHVLEHGAVLRSTGERIGNNWACVDADSAADLRRCTEQFKDFWVTYHPASHYWPIQLLESAVVLALTGAVVAVAFRVLRKHAP
ncbi:hypothetical protein ACIBL6_44860 [Streptomyces sp. NPDC050400]|uniref:hypothetical protein n=1 Tax=Streptomyces sp. NPDC050400 TaxID=3365610 RepID=UPI0037896CF0